MRNILIQHGAMSRQTEAQVFPVDRLECFGTEVERGGVSGLQSEGDDAIQELEGSGMSDAFGLDEITQPVPDS